MATGARLGAAALTGGLLLLSGCGSAPPGPVDGDCNARIVFRDTVFRGHNQTKLSMPTEKAALGTGDVVGCDLDPVDHVAIHKIKGVDPDVAIAVVDRQWRGVYVREGTGPSDWPSTILAPQPSAPADAR